MHSQSNILTKFAIYSCEYQQHKYSIVKGKFKKLTINSQEKKNELRQFDILQTLSRRSIRKKIVQITLCSLFALSRKIFYLFLTKRTFHKLPSVERKALPENISLTVL